MAMLPNTHRPPSLLFCFLLLLLLSQPRSTTAWAPPTYPGYTLIWTDAFTGAGGTLPRADTWDLVTGNLGVNGELETYQASPRNVQHSGGGTLQLVPWRDGGAAGGWTSGRVESLYTFAPRGGARTRAEAAVRFGSHAPARKQGLWPAFWLLGQALRQPGGTWPACGEIDVLETVDGRLTGYGTAHCGLYPGGVCDEPAGLQGAVAVPDQAWHAWRVEWDRTPVAGWSAETITWSLDGQPFHHITGAAVGDSAAWASLCHSPLYFILNLAVGGAWVSSLSAACLQTMGGGESTRALTDICGDSPDTPTTPPSTATEA